jgi:hypothetical protein
MRVVDVAAETYNRYDETYNWFVEELLELVFGKKKQRR